MPVTDRNLQPRYAQAAAQLLLVALVWAGSSALAPRWTPANPNASACIGVWWFCLLAASCIQIARTQLTFLMIGGAAGGAVWLFDALLFPKFVVLALAAHALARVSLGKRQFSRTTLVVGILPMLAPGVFVLLACALGDDATRAVVRSQWSVSKLLIADLFHLVEFGALASAAFASIGYAAAPTMGPKSAWVAIGVTATLVPLAILRTTSIASLAVLPGDAQWSEAPILLNLLKLHTGASFYAALEDCNSYSYSPTVELVHRTILVPFKLDLSLGANRMLALFWQCTTASLLTAFVWPFFTPAGLRRWQRAATLAGVALAMSMTAGSSFLAPNLHPDHLLMVGFALALGAMLHADRLPQRWLYAAILVLPALCSAFKMTGAGVGVGMAAAALTLGPTRKALWIAIAGSGAIAIFVLAFIQLQFPLFWHYTVELQASHFVAWGAWRTILQEAPTRVMLATLALFVALAVTRQLDRRVARECMRVLLTTAGFALPSFVAFLKVGGRSNSLLPLSLGAAVVLARIYASLAGNFNKRWGAAAMLTWAVATLSPPSAPVSARKREQLRAHYAQAVALVQGETKAQRRTLFYEGTAAWIGAGRIDVPRDRWQIANELAMGNHPELETHFKRLESGAYDSVILTRATFNPASPTSARLKRIFATHYQPDPGALPTQTANQAGDSIPPYEVYRYITQ